MAHRLTKCIYNSGISIEKKEKKNEKEANDDGEPYLRRYSCQYCGINLYKYNLLRHIKSYCKALPDDKTIREQAAQKQSLLFQQNKAKRKYFHCKPCKLRFNSQEAVKKHRLKCNSPRPPKGCHICPYCSYSFTTSGNLKRHLRISKCANK